MMKNVNVFDVKSLLAWQRVDLDGPKLHYVANRYAAFTLEVVDQPPTVPTQVDAQNVAHIMPAGVALRPGQTLLVGTPTEHPKSVYVRLSPETFGLTQGTTWPSFWSNVPNAAVLTEAYAKVSTGKGGNYEATLRGLAQPGALQSQITLVTGQYEVRPGGDRTRSIVMPANLLAEPPVGLSLNTLTWNGTHWGVAGQTQLCVAHPAALLGTGILQGFKRARLHIQFKYIGTSSINLAQQQPFALDVNHRNIPAVGQVQLQRLCLGAVQANTAGYCVIDAGPLEPLMGLENVSILTGGLAFGNWYGFNLAPATRQYNLQAFWVIDDGEPCANIDVVAYNMQVPATNITAGNGLAVWAPGSGQGVLQLDSFNDAVVATASISNIKTGGAGSIINDQVVTYIDEATPATGQATGVPIAMAAAGWIVSRQKSNTSCGWLLAGNAGSWSNARPGVSLRGPR